MIEVIKVSGFENESVEKLTLMEERCGLLNVSDYLFNKVVDGERENVLMRLLGRFKGLRYEDLEEVYDDGCLVLWNKMMDKDFKLEERGMVGYLIKICMNIGMHYLRKVKDEMVSFDMMMERGCEKNYDENGMEKFFDVLDEKIDEDERYEKLDKMWDKLKEVDRMILESYYVDGCKMEEIARRIGYKNGNSVKSRKNKVLRKIREIMMAEKQRGQSDDSIGSVNLGTTYSSIYRITDFSTLLMAA